MWFFVNILRKCIIRVISYILYITDTRRVRKCTICGFSGKFLYHGQPGVSIRSDAKCPSCGGLERHRLFGLYLIKNKYNDFIEPVLHFAPEKILERIMRPLFKNYQTTDLFLSKVDVKLDIEKLDLKSSSIGTIFCFHVLEHVDDKKALSELRRVLKKEGKLFIMVPIVEGWDKTYENSDIKDPDLRVEHFGQCDHVRFYGKDLRDRINAAGFENIEEFTAEQEDVVKYGLLRGEKLFVCC